VTFEFQVPQVISVCSDCVYFNEYGRLDDEAMARSPHAAELHRARIAATDCPWGTVFTPGCGRDCHAHGTAAYETEAAYEAARDAGDPEPWFSEYPCEQCGNLAAGNREHATAWTYLSPVEIKIRVMPDDELDAAIVRAAGGRQPHLPLGGLRRERAYRDNRKKEGNA
jgi:hypothetical protein